MLHVRHHIPVNGGFTVCLFLPAKFHVFQYPLEVISKIFLIIGTTQPLTLRGNHTPDPREISILAFAFPHAMQLQFVMVKGRFTFVTRGPHITHTLEALYYRFDLEKLCNLNRQTKNINHKSLLISLEILPVYVRNMQMWVRA